MSTIQRSYCASQPDSWDALPEQIRARLKLEEIDSPAAWRAAGRRRFMIFGIPPGMRQMLDAIARAAR